MWGVSQMQTHSLSFFFPSSLVKHVFKSMFGLYIQALKGNILFCGHEGCAGVLATTARGILTAYFRGKDKPGISPVPCMWLLHRFMCPFPLMLPNYLFQLLKTLFRSIIRYIIINEIHKIRNDPQNEATRSSSVKSEHSCCSFPHHPWSLWYKEH